MTELRIMQPHDERPVTATLELIARARRSLVEARTLPDIRRVIVAASVAADAAQRIARLADAQHAAAEIARAAHDAANDASAVRIEAQAKAGELLDQMAERGELTGPGRPEKTSRLATFSDLGVRRDEAHWWRRVASVPSDVRRDYVNEARTAQQEVTTTGLLKHAQGTSSRDSRPIARRGAVDHAAIAAASRRRMRDTYRVVIALPKVRPEALVVAIDSGARRTLLQALGQLRGWVEDVRKELAVHHVHEEE